MQLRKLFFFFLFPLTLVACTGATKTLTIPRADEPVSGIAFVTERNGNRDIYLIQPDGTGLTPLFTSPKPDSDPAFSPDGRTLAFRSRAEGSSEIFLAAADGSGVWLNVINDPADSADDEFHPAWNPNGLLLALYTDRFLPPIGHCSGSLGVHHLGLLAVNQSSFIEHFDDLPGEQNSLAWSADGQTLAFSSICTGEDVVLYTWDRTSHMVTPVTEKGYNAFDPAYSPDGKWLAFASDRDGAVNVFVMNLVTGDVRNLTQSSFTDSHPAWSPDSLWLAFTRNLGGNEEIFFIALAGGEAQNLTNSPGADLYPAWSPVGK